MFEWLFGNENSKRNKEQREDPVKALKDTWNWAKGKKQPPPSDDSAVVEVDELESQTRITRKRF